MKYTFSANFGELIDLTCARYPHLNPQFHLKDWNKKDFKKKIDLFFTIYIHKNINHMQKKVPTQDSYACIQEYLVEKYDIKQSLIEDNAQFQICDFHFTCSSTIMDIYHELYHCIELIKKFCKSNNLMFIDDNFFEEWSNVIIEALFVTIYWQFSKKKIQLKILAPDWETANSF